MVKKRKIGYFPLGSVIFSITLTLFILGIFGFLSLFAIQSYENLKKDLFITVFLKKSTSSSDINKLIKNLKSYDFVSSREQSIVLIKKEEIANNYFIETGDDFKNILSKNPFRDYLTIYLHEKYFDPLSLEKVKNKLEQYTEVFEITYPHQSVQKISTNISRGVIFFGILILILLLTNFLLISHVIKLAIYSQRFLIRSMQLVGAKNSHIQRPFIVRAIFHGIISGIIASLVLLSINQIIVNYDFEILTFKNNVSKLLLLLGILIIFGSIMSAISTKIAVKKYLKYSLHDLY